jgi:predicted phosphodiesterase
VRIRVLSDLHLEHHSPPEGLLPPDTDRADVVVLAGDIARAATSVRWAREAFPSTPVVCVAGNHEFYDRHLDATLPALEGASDRLPTRAVTRAGEDAAGTYFLQRDTVRIGDVRILGCTFWTGFGLFPGRRAPAIKACRAEMDDYRRIHLLRARRRLRPRDTDRFHRASVAWLRRRTAAETEARATVVVTHHAPSPQSIDPRYEKALTSAAFVARRERLVRETGAALWVHGHVHASLDYPVGETRVLANPRGHPGENPAFRPGLTVEV